jgi:GNAT superfamily N-acetyltransferase
MSFPRQITEVPAGKIAAIVTSLEMFSAPAPRPERSDLALSLRRIEQPDLDWFRALFRRTGEDWLWFSRLALTNDTLRAIIHDPAVEVYPLMAGEQEAGLLELDFRISGECELSFFGLLPEFIGSGAGRWLMNRAIQIAWSRPVRRLWVHTCTFDHPDALAFYLRSGFRAFRREVEICDDPRLTGAMPSNASPRIPIIG